jgi:hypothetical protein
MANTHDSGNGNRSLVTLEIPPVAIQFVRRAFREEVNCDAEDIARGTIENPAALRAKLVEGWKRVEEGIALLDQIGWDDEEPGDQELAGHKDTVLRYLKSAIDSVPEAAAVAGGHYENHDLDAEALERIGAAATWLETARKELG